MCSWLLSHIVYPVHEAGGRETAHKTVHTSWQHWRPYILLAWLLRLPRCVSVTLAVRCLCATLSLTEAVYPVVKAEIQESELLRSAIDGLYEKTNHLTFVLSRNRISIHAGLFL